MKRKDQVNITFSPDLTERLKRIADANHISLTDVVRICLAQGLPKVESGQITATTDHAQPVAA